MFLAFGVACALIEARGSGRGQVVDAAMTDGAGLLMAMTYSLKARGRWRAERQANLLDGGAPFYGVYRCADGKWVAVGALEPQFFAALVDKLGLDGRRVRRPLESPRLAGDPGAARSGLRRTVARRMGGAVRRFGRLRRARPRCRRGAAPSP